MGIATEIFLNIFVLSGVFLIVALGLNIMLALGRVVNLSHGSFYALGAYFGYTLVYSGVNFFLAIIIAPLLVGILGLILEMAVIAPLRKRPFLYTLILTYGLMFFLNGLIRYVWGRAPYLFQKLPAFLTGSLSFAGINYPAY